MKAVLSLVFPVTFDLQQGPSVAEMMASLGPAETCQRFHKVLLLLAESGEQAPRHAAE